MNLINCQFDDDDDDNGVGGSDGDGIGSDGGDKYPFYSS